MVAVVSEVVSEAAVSEAAVRTEPKRRTSAHEWCPPRLEPVALRRPQRLPASTYRRRRAVAAGLVVVLVLMVAAALGMLGGGPLPASERPTDSSSALRPGVTYVVQPGDTFWSIARQLDPDGDPRPLVDRLVAAHGGTTLHVGERLPLPLGAG